MSDLTVFVNERPVRVPAGADVAAAVAAFDAALGAKLAQGAAYATDGRGIEVAPAAPLAAGAILRVVVSARRREGDADA